MASFNKIILMGNLTRDPQLNYLPSNTPVVEIGLAVNRRYKRQDGQQVDQVLFIDCRAIARTAEVINQYFKKGKPIFIEGRLQLDQWTDKTGQKRSKHRVHIDTFQFVEGRGGDAQGGGGNNGPARANAPSAPPDEQQPPANASQGYEHAQDMAAEDIPF